MTNLLKASVLFSAGVAALFSGSDAQASPHHNPHHQPKPQPEPTQVNNTTNIQNVNPTSSSHSQSDSSASLNSSVDNSNSARLSTVTITNNNDQHFGFSSGAKLPSSQFNVNYINRDGEDIVQAGISIPLGVKKSTILRDVERTHQLEEAKFCLDMVASGVQMSPERLDFFNCDGFIYPEVELYAPVVEQSEYDLLKQSMIDYRNELKAAQELNQSLLDRIKLLQTPASNLPVRG
ncbi:MAG: hypothetical protein ACRDBG_02900 [Waterburya sp.]